MYSTVVPLFSHHKHLARAVQCLIVCLLIQATSVFALNFNITLASLTNHNTSAYPAYNENNFPANFGTTSWINPDGATIPVDPTQMDMSLNPVTPGHVSKMDVHTLIPSRPDLRWFAHGVVWFNGTAGSHINIGLNCNTTAYVASMVTDMENRGFNGIIIDWYGSNSFEDQVTLKLQTYLAGIPTNTFRFIIMVDKGVSGGLATNNLQAQIQYCQNQYFNDPNYEREPTNGGNPILMFFGVASVVGNSGMAGVKAALGGQMVWVEQGTGYLGQSWEDECFEWTDSWDGAMNTNDPFNLSGVTGNYSTIASSGKKAFGALCAKFNGTLTKSVSWSEGKYLPSSNGLCEIERAAAINAAIPANMTRMQWPTWDDWEEGTAVEPGVENDFAVTNRMISTNILGWTIISGDERTVDHYEIYDSTDGVNAAFLTSVQTGLYQTSLSKFGLPPGTNWLYVEAIGKPCIRDHLSPAVMLNNLVVVNSPEVSADVQPLSQLVYQGDEVSFAVSALGAAPLSFQWTLNSQAIPGATNSAYAFAALAGTNYYQLIISNSYGQTNSSVASVIGLPATFVTASNYYTMKISFSGYTNATPLTDFPVLVRLSTNIPGFSYSQLVAPATGADLRFAAENGREIPFEIDQWNPSGESDIWVQVPSIASNSDYITACWGDSADSALEPCNTNGATWFTLSGSNNFESVYHLRQNSYPYLDSTLQHPITNGVAPASGASFIGNYATFNAPDYLDAGVINLGTSFTASAWVNLNSSATNIQTILDSKTGGTSSAGFSIFVNGYNTANHAVTLETGNGTTGQDLTTGANALSFGQWHLVSVTADQVAGTAEIYIDGVSQSLSGSVQPGFPNDMDVNMGRFTNGYWYWNGSMDEVRIQSGIASPAWVWASWATVADSAFASYGNINRPGVSVQTQTAAGQFVLMWTSGVLQCASNVAGPYANVATVSPYTVSMTNAQQYFRVKLQ